ncbi:hypothetical protein FHT40_006090 [Mycolicibacterium sp. BK556]|uniref:hypothetical protein n=1 Tax=unclassified Mycolicibacterium TaxID=2636767 RepID=UPI001607C6E1|nr:MULTISPECIES: hypothetical protein [unclassified Mycolicibacterium]MBB3606399.1 hypothetical protein [Mycolicibacterium sp. BK556]MBB3636355.1 hypothetical protein [Mycolicibacterium sp. BK607]
MAPAEFAMEPESTSAGLTSAGQLRAQVLASGLPVLPVGNYVSGYSALVEAVLAGYTADLSERVAKGMTQAATSVATMQNTEQTGQTILSS